MKWNTKLQENLEHMVVKLYSFFQYIRQIITHCFILQVEWC